MLGARRSKHCGALPVEQDHRPQVHADLQVHVLGLLIGDRRPDTQAGVVDEHVEPAIALAVAVHDRTDALLVGHVRRHVLDLEPLVAQLLGGLLERLGPPRRDREAIALLTQRLGDREADPSRASGDDGGAVWHRAGPY